MDDTQLWTGGRYFLQAEKQLSSQWKLMCMGEDPAVEIWLSDSLWCVSIDIAQRWVHAFEKKRQTLVQTSMYPVDEIWEDRPVSEVNPDKVQTLELAGRLADKLQNLRVKLAQDSQKVDNIVLTALDEVHKHMKDGKIEVQDYAVVRSDVHLLASSLPGSSFSVNVGTIRQGDGWTLDHAAMHYIQSLSLITSLGGAKALKVSFLYFFGGLNYAFLRG